MINHKDMERDDFATKVVFRKYKNGSIIALFPEIPAAFGEVASYTHMNGHGGSHYKLVMNPTKSATEAEYMPLFNELVAKYGYQLDVRKKMKVKSKIWDLTAGKF